MAADFLKKMYYIMSGVVFMILQKITPARHDRNKYSFTKNILKNRPYRIFCTDRFLLFRARLQYFSSIKTTDKNLK